jgi:hypothetical protein
MENVPFQSCAQMIRAKLKTTDAVMLSVSPTTVVVGELLFRLVFI